MQFRDKIQLFVYSKSDEIMKISPERGGGRCNNDEFPRTFITETQWAPHFIVETISPRSGFFEMDTPKYSTCIL